MTQAPTLHDRGVARTMLEISREECLELLASQSVGRIAVSGRGNAPLIRPVNYVFDQPSRSVVFRTAGGTKLHALARAGHAAFETDRVDPAGRVGWSVIIVGVPEEVTAPAEVRRLEGLGLDTWAPGKRSYWFRIRAWTVSGRKIPDTKGRND